MGQRPWQNITLTHGFTFIFSSGGRFRIGKDQFALVATPHRCVRGRTVRECDGFKLLQLDAGNGRNLQPIDVERLVNGEDPIDPFYSGFSEAQRQSADEQMSQKIGDKKYVISDMIDGGQGAANLPAYTWSVSDNLIFQSFTIFISRS